MKPVVSICFVLPLFWACLDAPTPPETPLQPAEIAIVDSLGFSLDELNISYKDSPCVQATNTDPMRTGAYTLQWFINDSLADTSSGICIHPLAEIASRFKLVLIAKDAFGNSSVDSLTVLVDSPPSFSTDSNQFMPTGIIASESEGSMGPLFIWNATDPDRNDTLEYLLRIGNKGLWTDSIRISSLQSIRYPHRLLGQTEYQWQVVAKDRFGALDSTPILKFTTRSVWDEPGYIHGTISLTAANRTTRPTSLYLVAETMTGDTIHVPIRDDFSFYFQPGIQTDSLLLFATEQSTNLTSDSVRVKTSATQAIEITTPLEY